MNKWRITFIFLTGFMLRELMGHIWLNLDGVLPFTSRIFGITITTELNMLLIAINVVVFLFCAYFGFLHSWEPAKHVERHA